MQEVAKNGQLLLCIAENRLEEMNGTYEKAVESVEDLERKENSVLSATRHEEARENAQTDSEPDDEARRESVLEIAIAELQHPEEKATIAELEELNAKCTQSMKLCAASLDAIGSCFTLLSNRWIMEVEPCMVSIDQVAKKLREADGKSYFSTYACVLNSIGPHKALYYEDTTNNPFIRPAFNAYIVLQGIGAVEDGGLTHLMTTPI